jgi:hypothetical protein
MNQVLAGFLCGVVCSLLACWWILTQALPA